MRTILDDQNTIVVNAACCSDPGVMCERCAAEAQQIANEDDADLLGLPVTNWSSEGKQVSYAGQADFWPPDDDDVFEPAPGLMDLLYAEQEQQQQPKPEPMFSALVINDDDDPDLLPLPSTWS